MKKLFALFWEVFRISLLVIGGGYALVSVADAVFAKRGWTREGELIDNLPTYQMIPGILAGHNAVYVGSKVAGALGAFVALTAAILPSIAVFTIVSAGYETLPLDNRWLSSAFTGLRSALAGIVSAAFFTSWKRNVNDDFGKTVFFAAAIFVGLFDFPVWLVLLSALLLGLYVEYCRARNEGRTFRSSWVALLIFLKYGALAFGGGYVLVPMYLQDFVGPAAAYLQIPECEFSDLMSLTQMTPGPIGVNGATFFGFRLAGAGGAVLASLFMVLPGSIAAFVVFRALAKFRQSAIVAGVMRGVRPVSSALLLIAFFSFLPMCVFNAEGVFSVTGAALVPFAALMVFKKRIGIMTTIFICMFSAMALRADTVTPERYPDAHMVMIDSKVDIRYNADGTYSSEEVELIKALTERGRRELSTLSIGYSLRYGRAEIAEVEIIGADGGVRKVDFASTLKEATDNSSQSANIYDPLDKVLSCAVAGLKVGETRRTVVRRTVDRPRVRDHWADIEVLEYTFPIVRAEVAITGPVERPLRSIALRNPLGNVVSSVVTNAGDIVYRWTAENSPQAFPEPNMPPLWTEAQNLRVSTAADWKEISRWYWEVSRPHLEKTNAAMTNKVAEILAEAGPERGERIRALFKFVSQEIRYMGLTMEDTSPGYAPHDVDVTFDNRYGVCRDKAALLTAMLRMAGIEAYPVLISAGAAKMDTEVPQPYFNHAIVAVAEGDGYELMDPTDESSRDLFPSYLSDCSYLVARSEGERLLVSPTVDAEKNAVLISGDGRLNRDGSLLVDYTIDFTGVNDNAYRGAMLARKEEERRNFFEESIRAEMPGAEVLRFRLLPENLQDTEKPLRAQVLARFPDALLRSERRVELAALSLSARLGCVNWLLRGRTALERRRYPLKLSTTAMTSERLTVDLAGNAGRDIELPEEISIEGPYSFRRSVSRRGERLTIERRLSVGAVEFDPDAYGELRENIKLVEAAERCGCVFAVDRLAGADVRILSREIDCSLSSADSWVVTNRVVKEVLTYDGKKSSAELKFDYNPSWKKVTLLSASVSNRNGTVVHAGEKEINTMDASWVSAAPRYPASRQLVVNLPSVEIGSVIDYTVVSKVERSPIPFYGLYWFDSPLPVDRLRVRVGEWRREVAPARLLPDENMLPDGRYWRDYAAVSSNDFARAARKLAAASHLEKLSPAGLSLPRDIRQIRDWMAKHVRVCGPAFSEIRFEDHLVDPATVVRERYATRVGYVAALCALLRGAGFDADVVFAASPGAFSGGEKGEREFYRDTVETPDERKFAFALCRVKIREGGFLGFGGAVRTVFIGTENEYTPLGASGFDGARYFDPLNASFGRVEVDKVALRASGRNEIRVFVRENGSVDFEQTLTLNGVEAGVQAKRYAEMLPEIRERHHQSLLGSIAQAASATGALTTDFDGTTFSRSFSAYVPKYASLAGGALTLKLPMLAESRFPLEGSARTLPIGIDGCTCAGENVITVFFPKGYKTVEHLPEPYRLVNPADSSEVWHEMTVAHEEKNGALEVQIVLKDNVFAPSVLPPSYFALLKDWERIGRSRESTTVSAVR